MGSGMSGKSPIRSRNMCPECGSPLFYVKTLFFFITGSRKRVCLAPECHFEDDRRFRIAGGRHDQH
jgi:hypothetical protein